MCSFFIEIETDTNNEVDNEERKILSTNAEGQIILYVFFFT